jgi:hypothetical protein
MRKAGHWTRPAGVTPHLGREEAEARHQHYIGPEHLLVGLLRRDDLLDQGDDRAADLLRAHGLDLATVRAGIDLDAVHERLEEEFGWETWYDAAQWLRLRSVQPLPHAPGAGRRSPLHLLLGLLGDAERPVAEGLASSELRLRSMLGLPNSGPNPVKPLVEHEGLTLEGLQAAVRAALDDGE